MAKKKQFVVTYNKLSYTFHTNGEGMYNSSHPNASPRNNYLINQVGMGAGTMININNLKDRLS